MALLLVAGALTFMAYGLQSPRDKNNAILAAALIIVVTLTCLMSYLQERAAGNVMGKRAGPDPMCASLVPGPGACWCSAAHDRQCWLNAELL